MNRLVEAIMRNVLQQKVSPEGLHSYKRFGNKLMSQFFVKKIIAIRLQQMLLW